MKERPIIFSTESVRAILSGKKTQTRRVMKKWIPENCHYSGCTEGIHYIERPVCHDTTLMHESIGRCPFGVPGDRLWVKEAFWIDERDKYAVVFDDGIIATKSKVWKQNGQLIQDFDGLKRHRFWHHKSPLFMPRYASRLLLEVTAVRVERLQDIDNGSNDVKAEGFDGGDDDVHDFYVAWDKLNARRGYSSLLNPYVWVVEFKKVETK
jgi:hypothetical protein